MRWTPYTINVILHHHTRYSPFPENHTKLYEDTVKEFTEIGLFVRAQDGTIATTDMAAALIDLWRCTPLPRQKWVDPRFDGGE